MYGNYRSPCATNQKGCFRGAGVAARPFLFPCIWLVWKEDYTRGRACSDHSTGTIACTGKVEPFRYRAVSDQLSAFSQEKKLNAQS